MDNIHPNERLPYSAIIDREPLKLPNNARVIIWPILALEVWDIIRPMARMISPHHKGFHYFQTFQIGVGMNMVCALVFGG